MSRPIGFRKIDVTISVAGTAVQLTTEKIFTSFVEVHFPTGNSGNVYVGDSTVDNTWIPRAANTTLRISASERGDITKGDYFDLSRIYFDAATGGDTAIVQYLAAEG